MTDKEIPSDQKSASYEIFILLLSLLSLFNLAIFLLPNLNPLVKGVVSIMDIFITLIFLTDFLFRLFTVPSKSEYFLRGWGWADFLSSVPFQQFKVLRIFRVVKVVRLLRHFGQRKVLAELRYHRASSALFLTTFLVIIVLEFGGGLIVAIEADDPSANIKTAGDGVWWAFVTITTVGYGDRVPVTEFGRLTGMLTMTLGVALFGVLTGFLANAFIPPKEEIQLTEPTGKEAIDDIHEFWRLLEEQERLTASLKVKLAHIEAEMKPERR